MEVCKHLPLKNLMNTMNAFASHSPLLRYFSRGSQVWPDRFFDGGRLIVAALKTATTWMSPLPQTAAPRLRVLLVDDHSIFLDAVETFLRSFARFDIVGRAGDGLEAVRMAERLSPDLILMDMAMPVLNGLEATARIKESPSAPQIIIITLQDEIDYRTSFAAVGADGFVPKKDFTAVLPSVIFTLFPQTAPQKLNA